MAGFAIRCRRQADRHRTYRLMIRRLPARMNKAPTSPSNRDNPVPTIDHTIPAACAIVRP